MSYDHHSSSTAAAVYFPFPEHDACRIEARELTVSIVIDGQEVMYGRPTLDLLIADLIAAREAMNEIGSEAHSAYVADGHCSARHTSGLWCGDDQDHPGPHWAPRQPDPSMPVDRITNPDRTEWT